MSLKNSKTFKWLSKQIGIEPAEAFMLKNISHFNLFPELLNINLCFENLKDSNQIIVISEFIGSSEWIEIFKLKLKYVKILKVSKTAFSINYLLNFIKSFCLSFKIFFSFITKRGITFKKKPLKNYKFISEFIDPNKLKGGIYDADCFINSNHITKLNSLFFLTSSQRNFLKSQNYHLNEIKNIFSKNKYNLIVLDEVKYSLDGFIELANKLKFLIFYVLKEHGDLVYNKVLNNAWNDYLDYYSLFSSQSANSLLYYTFPNGRTTFRLNDGIVTGLCRQSNIKSIGIQSRTIYTSKYEDCFDCFDRYLSWGNSWDLISINRTKYIKEIKHIGCFYLDDLKKYNIDDLHSFKKKIIGNKNFLISVFDGDISPHSHYTWEYAKSFITDVMKLAKENSKCKFVIKTKDTSNKGLYLKNPLIKDLYNKNDNIIFIDNERNDYKLVLNASDIVLAIGFTTPGFEALSLEKRTIYYSMLKNGGKAFKHLPNIVASNYNKLKCLFRISLNDKDTFYQENRENMELLNYSKINLFNTNYLTNFN